LYPVWDAATIGYSLVYHGHDDEALGLAWSPDGKYIASASRKGSAHVWDASSGATLVTYEKQLVTDEMSKYQPGATGICWSPDGTQIATVGFGGTVHIWDAGSGETQLVYEPRRKDGCVAAVAWSPDGQRIASTGEDGTSIWHAQTGETLLRHVQRSEFSNFRVAWSPDGSKILSTAYKNYPEIWDAVTGQTLLTYDADHVTAAWSPDGRFIASAPYHGAFDVWDAHTGQTLATGGEARSVNSLAWSPDGTHIVGGGDRAVFVWRFAREASAGAAAGTPLGETRDG
jgi:WD40 repeat protein